MRTKQLVAKWTKELADISTLRATLLEEVGKGGSYLAYRLACDEVEVAAAKVELYTARLATEQAAK